MLDRWLFARIDAGLYGLVRLFFGLSGICKFTGLTSPLPRLVQGGFDLGFPLHRYGPSYFAPGFLPGDLLPPPSFALYCQVEGVALFLAFLVTFGVLSRLSTLAFAACCWWLLLVDPAGFKHNLFALAVFGILIAASPCGQRFSVDGRVWKKEQKPLIFWLRLIQVQLVIVYFFSTVVKLNDGWATGHLLASGAAKSAARAKELGLEALVPLIEFRPWYAVVSWVTVAIEGFLVVGFLVPRLRLWALFLGVVLHTGIDLSLDVGSYSLTMFAVYVAFCDPRLRQTRVEAPPVTAAVLRALDWTCRLEVVPGPRFQGDVLGVLRRLPLTFPGAFVVEKLRAWRDRRAVNRAA